MNTYHVVSFNPQTTDAYQVHKHNCKDALKAGTQGHGLYAVMAGNPEEAARKELKSLDQSFGGDGESGYSIGDWRIMPCCKG